MSEKPTTQVPTDPPADPPPADTATPQDFESEGGATTEGPVARHD